MKELKKKKKYEDQSKPVRPVETQVQYVPYEHYISRVLTAMKTQLDLIEKHMDVIKERITNDYPAKDAKD